MTQLLDQVGMNTLGYGIIDLEKAIKAIDSFQNGYFTSFDSFHIMKDLRRLL